MEIVRLRKIKSSDKVYFAKWWRDKTLAKLTSGNLEHISDEQLDRGFSSMLHDSDDLSFIITVDAKPIGHIALTKQKNGWHETQIVIGEKAYWNKGYGTKAIQLLIKKGKQLEISKIFLEVRPDNARAIKAYEKVGFKSVGIKKYPNNPLLPETLKMVLNK